MPAPTPRRLFFFFLVVAGLLFLRPPSTNFIFDEQEALLANPYLQGETEIWRAFQVDFWGRPPARTIGSYRPLPNLLWWPLSFTLDWNTPWVLCLVNLLVHATSTTLLCLAIDHVMRSAQASLSARTYCVWGAGLFVVTCATSTEAVCSAVGLADLLVGLFTSAALYTLARAESFGLRSVVFRSVALFGCVFLGLLSKETMLASLAWLPLVAWLLCFRAQPSSVRWGSALAAWGAACLALIAFVVLRESQYVSAKAEVAPLVAQGPLREPLHWFLGWFRQPKMPINPVNNALVEASSSERWATSALMFLDQVRQFIIPFDLAADHSFPRQSVVSWGPGSIAGAAAFVLMCGGAVISFLAALRCKARTTTWLLLTLGLLVTIFSYLPVSNALVLLPTIRADRLLYPTAIGLGLLVAALLSSLQPRHLRVALVVAVAFLALQAFQARRHAFDYWNDVTFWNKTSQGEPASAKSHLNLGVMLGARGNEGQRLVQTRRAVALAPDWPMARIYLADSLCRLGRLAEAWPHYMAGFRSAPNSKALTALGLQCLWDAGGFPSRKDQLLDLAVQHPDTWLDYFVTELARNGEVHDGIERRFRPRKYNARAALK